MLGECEMVESPDFRFTKSEEQALEAAGLRE